MVTNNFHQHINFKTFPLLTHIPKLPANHNLFSTRLARTSDKYPVLFHNMCQPAHQIQTRGISYHTNWANL